MFKAPGIVALALLGLAQASGPAQAHSGETARFEPKLAAHAVTHDVAENPARRTKVAAVARRLAHGINFDQVIYGTKQWGAPLTDEQAAMAKSAGFSAVRLPVPFAKFQSKEPPYTLAPAFLAKVDAAIALLRRHDLAIVLDNHADEALCSDPATGRARLDALWRQLGEHYAQAPDDLVFEIFAEPHGALEGVWNDVFASALAKVRASNPLRTVVVGPVQYNNVSRLGQLALPADDGLLVCIHDYRPLKFTFQGENIPGHDTHAWVGTAWTGTPAERGAIAADLNAAISWGKAHGRPMYLEEFGSSGHADLASRARLAACYREEAERRGLPWCVWAFSPTYPVFDQAAGHWYAPLVDALFPRAAQ